MVWIVVVNKTRHLNDKTINKKCWGRLNMREGWERWYRVGVVNSEERN